MANNQPNVNSITNITMLRDYRKGNWTVQETMVLIEAKKMDEERRMKRSEGVKSSGGELRWKWVEDYCWRYGCLRSQNQCNDKWDNLMRDFKRVRDHQRRLLASQAEASSVGAELKSYWDIDKLERKERSLPSSMLAEVYDALLEVVEKRSGGFKSSGGSDYSNVNNMVRTHAVLVQPVSNVMPLAPSEPPLMALPTPHSVDPPLVTVGEQVHCQRSVDCDTSEHSDLLPSKRRKKEGARDGDGASTSTTNIGSEISKSACLIAEVIKACDEREEARHKELLTLHQKRIQIEESKAEITKQGMNGLVDAINNLANSILDLANSNKN